MRTKDLIRKILLIVMLILAYEAPLFAGLKYEIIDGNAYINTEDELPEDIPAKTVMDGVIYPVVGFYFSVINDEYERYSPERFNIPSTINLPSTIRQCICKYEAYDWKGSVDTETLIVSETKIFSLEDFFMRKPMKFSDGMTVTPRISGELLSINVAEGGEYYSSYEGVLYNADQTQLLLIPTGRYDVNGISPNTIKIGEKAAYKGSLEHINLESNITEIGEYAFAGTFLNEITFPQSLKSIGKGAFFSIYWPQNTELLFPNGLTDVGEEAFDYDYDFSNQLSPSPIKKLSLPASVTTIGSKAFAGITPETIEYLTDTPITADSTIFSESCYTKSTLVVPDEAIETFRSTWPWSNFANIRGSSGIKNVEAVDSRFSIRNGEITIYEGDEVSIYSLSGQCIWSGREGTIAPAKGVYLIKTPTSAAKIVL